MCKLSWNIVPNVYNSLQSSFLSLSWPWPGRSLSKGNQREWWDPQQGPLPGLGMVGHSPRGTSGSTGTLDWGPVLLGSQSTCQPNTPLHPLTAPYTPRRPHFPLCYLYPFWPWVTTLPFSPSIHPWHPLHLWCPLMAPKHPLHPLRAPISP